MKTLCIYLIALALAVGALTLPAVAQDDMTPDDWGTIPAITDPAATDEGPENEVTFDFRDAAIDQVLRVLFQSAGASYVLSPDVKGRVSVNLTNVPFNVALRHILDQVKATYRQEGNVYSIIPVTGETQVSEATEALRTPMRLRVIEVRFAEAYEIAYLFGGTASGAYGNYGAFGDSYGNNQSGRGNNRGRTTGASNRNTNTRNTGGTNTGGSYNTGGGYSNVGGGGGGMMGGPGGGFGGFGLR